MKKSSRVAPVSIFPCIDIYIFRVCPLRRVSPLAKKVTSGIRSKPCMILCVSSRSPLFRLSSYVVRLHSFNLYSYGNFLNEVIILVARCWTCSSVFISFFKYGAHACMQYSRYVWSYCCLVDWYYCVNFLVADGSSELS